MKVFIVIPAYNEQKQIQQVIAQVKKEGYPNILVVDDGSGDQTFLVARETGVNVVRHVINRGKGAATKTGLRGALLLGADIVVTIDGDGQHDPGDIPKVVQPLLDQKVDVVLGNRFKGDNKIPLIRKIYNRVGDWFTFVLGGVLVSDSQSGFRAYSSKAIKMIDTKGDRYEFESEIIHEIAANKLNFVEVPIKVRYTEYSLSKGQNFKNGIKTVLRLFFRKVI